MKEFMNLNEYLEEYRTLTLTLMDKIREDGEIDILIEKREDILKLQDNYLKNNYLYSKKRNRIFLINKFFFIKDLENQNNIFVEKIWIDFWKKWKNYEEDKDMYQE